MKKLYWLTMLLFAIPSVLADIIVPNVPYDPNVIEPIPGVPISLTLAIIVMIITFLIVVAIEVTGFRFFGKKFKIKFDLKKILLMVFVANLVTSIVGIFAVVSMR